jgi:serine/threonine protein kinase
VLIDFGSARQRLSERSLTVVESAGYTPYEQLQSRGNIGPWSDLYALGATLVKTMTGEAPPKTNDRSFGDPWLPLAS